MAQRFPFSGIPSGWYMVGTSSELRPGTVLTRKYFGTELVLYRTEQGVFRATDPFCPHLGAHLGQGSVCGEELKCAFHGFRFDTDGKCTGTPYPSGRAPRKADLRLYPTRELNGMLLAFYDALGREPTWEVPDLDMANFPDFRWNDFELNSHPQETSENSVDIGHFAVLHDFMDAASTGPLELDGPLLRSKYTMKRRLDFIPGMREQGVRADFNVFVHGLGYSLVVARSGAGQARDQVPDHVHAHSRLAHPPARGRDQLELPHPGAHAPGAGHLAALPDARGLVRRAHLGGQALRGQAGAGAGRRRDRGLPPLGRAVLSAAQQRR
jgi:nitrite reductase/ring-hydroxylating ferredoxin subunit